MTGPDAWIRARPFSFHSCQLKIISNLTLGATCGSLHRLFRYLGTSGLDAATNSESLTRT